MILVIFEYFQKKSFRFLITPFFYPGKERKYELDLPFLQKMVFQKKEIYQPSDEEAPLRNQVSTRVRDPWTNRGWAQSPCMPEKIEIPGTDQHH